MASADVNDLCREYGSFMHAMRRPEAEALYWVWFVLVLFILFGASWHFGRVMERVEHMKVGDSKRQRMLSSCFYRTVASGLVSLAVSVLEVFVLLALQFCSQEPLASLYWSTWTVLQVGAVVAIFGICLHVRHMIRGRRNPPWALALGTPVLVVAGIGHYLQGKFRRKARSVSENLISRNRSLRSASRSRSRALSEAPTDRCISTDAENSSPARDERRPTSCADKADNFDAKIIGYTDNGDVIIRLSPSIASAVRAAVKRQPGGISWEPTPVLRTQRGRSNSLSMLSRQRSGSLRRQSLSPIRSMHDGDGLTFAPDRQSHNSFANHANAMNPSTTVIEGQPPVHALKPAASENIPSTTVTSRMDWNEKEASS